MIENKPMKWIGFFIAAGLLPFSAVAQDKGGATWGISGWINEALIHFDDGDKSDVVQASDNGTTLGSRITLAGSFEPENSGLDAGLEVILEPLSNETPLINLNQDDDGHTGANLNVLGTSAYFGGAFGRLTVGLQSMPTDNIAVLADPSLTLWSSISPVFRGNGFFLVDDGNRPGAVWGDFLNCYTAEGLRGAGGIGIDCNGIYRNGVRYDLPTAHEDMSISFGYANDDVFDIAFKFKRDVGRMKFLLNVGYAENHSVDFVRINPNINRYWALQTAVDRVPLTDPITAQQIDAITQIAGIIAQSDPDNMELMDTLGAFGNPDGATNPDGTPDLIMAGDTLSAERRAAFDRVLDRVFTAHAGNADQVYYDEASNLQIQLGLMHMDTGVFGTLAYQNESADIAGDVLTDFPSDLLDDVAEVKDELEGSDAWWLKFGIKRAFTSVGDTAITFQYGQYNDQFGFAEAVAGVTDSEVQRIGFSVDQYFGSRLIVYGAYESLDLDVDGSARAERLYGGVDDLDIFTAGMTFFF